MSDDIQIKIELYHKDSDEGKRILREREEIKKWIEEKKIQYGHLK